MIIKFNKKESEWCWVANCTGKEATSRLGIAGNPAY